MVSATSGGTFTGNVTFNGSFTSVGIDDNADATAITIDSSERVLIGTTTAETLAPTTTPKVQIEGTDHHTSSLSIVRNSNDNGQSLLILGKSRGTSIGADTVVQDDDNVGEVLFTAADGSDRTPQVASVKAAIDGTPGSNDMPGRLVFSTTADGSQTITERMIIDSSGKVGIATTNPLSALHIKDNDGITLEDDGTTNASKIQTLNAGGLRFYTGDTSSQTSRMTIETDGDVTIADGNLVIGTAGHGIDFSANTESAVSGVSSQAELLNFYEEGDWTPVPYGASTSGSVTSGTLTGKYTRIGRMVHVEARANAVVLSSANGSYYIDGLPFTVGGTGYNSGSVSLYKVDFDPDTFVEINGSGTTCYFLVSRDNTTWTTLDQSAFGSQHYWFFTLIYTV